MGEESADKTTNVLPTLLLMKAMKDFAVPDSEAYENATKEEYEAYAKKMSEHSVSLGYDAIDEAQLPKRLGQIYAQAVKAKKTCPNFPKRPKPSSNPNKTIADHMADLGW